MKSRFLTFGLAVVSALITVALFLFAFSRIAPALAEGGTGNLAGASQPASAIIARRLISVPFGINESVNLLEGDRHLKVSGHGNCGEEGLTYKLRVDVTQGSTGAQATSRTQGECNAGERFMWSTIAEAIPAPNFQPGEARACGMVIVYPEKGAAVVGKWCRDVTLH